MLAIGIRDVIDARERIARYVHRTPLLHSTTFSEWGGCKVFLKAENLQKTGSFKIRGATNKILSLDGAEGQRGVITASSGNHGQAVACAASKCGYPAIVVMPENGSSAKAESIKGYGAELIFCGTTSEARLDFAEELRRERGLTFVHPYDDPFVMAGQGTIGLEILEDLDDVDAVLVPTGGCGLISGIATAIKEKSPGTKVYGVEPEGSDSTGRSFAAGERTPLHTIHTVADGIRTTIPGEWTFPIVKKHVDGMLTVSDEEILNAERMILERCKLLAEPTGSVALAAILSGKIPADLKGKKIVSIVSGGNVALSQLAVYMQGN